MLIVGALDRSNIEFYLVILGVGHGLEVHCPLSFDVALRRVVLLYFYHHIFLWSIQWARLLVGWVLILEWFSIKLHGVFLNLNYKFDVQIKSIKNILD